jgi:hypothetical protein
MPFKFTKVAGKPVGLYLALLAEGASAAPSTVTATVAAGGATAGATSISVDALSAAIPKNTVLVFSRAAGSPDTVTVVTTAEAASAATSIPVESFDGSDGDGIAYDLAAADEATWDGLYTAVGTENSPYSNNPQTQDLNAVTYGGSGDITVSTPSVQSLSPSISRTGLWTAEGQLIQDLMTYGDTNRNWWAKQVLPDADGAPWAQRAGLARVSNMQHDPPADGLIRISYDIRFVGSKPTLTFPGVA